MSALRTVRASEVRRRRVEWLWQDRIPLGAVTILAGMPGVSKSTLAVWLAAGVSQGTLPGSLLGRPAGSLLVSVEDDPESVLRPRLEAAGAELGLIEILEGVWEQKSESVDQLTLPLHVEQLTEHVGEYRVRFLLLDPIGAVLDEKIDSWKDASVRRALAPLAGMAAECDCAVLLNAHLNKSVGTSAMQRLGGSIGFSGAPRSALLMAADPTDPDGENGPLRCVAHFKSNLGKEAPTIGFRVEQTLLPATTESDEVTVPRLVPTGDSALRSDELLSVVDSDSRTMTDDAVELVASELANGPRPAKEMQAIAKANGVGDKALRTARVRLGVVTRKADFQDGWEWNLPNVPSNVPLHGEGHLGSTTPFADTARASS